MLICIGSIIIMTFGAFNSPSQVPWKVKTRVFHFKELSGIGRIVFLDIKMNYLQKGRPVRLLGKSNDFYLVLVMGHQLELVRDADDI